MGIEQQWFSCCVSFSQNAKIIWLNFIPFYIHEKCLSLKSDFSLYEIYENFIKYISKNFSLILLGKVINNQAKHCLCYLYFLYLKYSYGYTFIFREAWKQQQKKNVHCKQTMPIISLNDNTMSFLHKNFSLETKCKILPLWLTPNPRVA